MDAIIVVLIAAVDILLYSLLYRALNGGGEGYPPDRRDNETQVYASRIAGVIFFGLIPLVAIGWILDGRLTAFGFVFVNSRKVLKWIVPAILLVVPACILQSKSAGNLKQYPQIRILNWNFRIFFSSALTWMAYLLSYEFFFRGVLLFACWNALGLEWAIAVNVVFYALAHIHKGRFEVIGSIPLGAVLCLLTVYTGSFWMAFFIHASIALTNEWASLYFSKQIHFRPFGESETI
ncbi:CPBP family intramembrane glutamic endopeptidase [Mangrovibacterium lignilyticum]|uniref:CPBP family intramembrane glutamic endopeptidase n=1 Tax=Mangrovibacterium lignilyticum TaxID=2668052 RepID=UPI0013D34BBF|nr:CPBP family intramembrane glutamic endopeptidase [Mangrovibacterium lignilyticum]